MDPGGHSLHFHQMSKTVVCRRTTSSIYAWTTEGVALFAFRIMALFLFKTDHGKTQMSSSGDRPRSLLDGPLLEAVLSVQL